MISRTVYCQAHGILEDIERVRRIDKAGEGEARVVYGTSYDGCHLAFMSSLTWKKGPQ